MLTTQRRWKWIEKKNLWPFECRENWKKFCMFYVPLQSLACHKNLLFVVFLSHSILCTSLNFFFVTNNNFYALFVNILLLVLCRQLSCEHILLHATIFLCKESYYRKMWKKFFPRKVNKVIEAELCASWLISFEEVQKRKRQGTSSQEEIYGCREAKHCWSLLMFIRNFTSLSMHNEMHANGIRKQKLSRKKGTTPKE